MIVIKAQAKAIVTGGLMLIRGIIIIIIIVFLEKKINQLTGRAFSRVTNC